MSIWSACFEHIQRRWIILASFCAFECTKAKFVMLVCDSEIFHLFITHKKAFMNHSPQMTQVHIGMFDSQQNISFSLYIKHNILLPISAFLWFNEKLNNVCKLIRLINKNLCFVIDLLCWHLLAYWWQSWVSCRTQQKKVTIRHGNMNAFLCARIFRQSNEPDLQKSEDIIK